jgi:hypothetical protein
LLPENISELAFSVIFPVEVSSALAMQIMRLIKLNVSETSGFSL